MGTSWKDTDIWKKLSKIQDDEADRVRAFLTGEKGLDKVEKILTSGVSQKDFTLHDADHSFRVAQRMWELIPENTKGILSEYELAFLLLSAYLHDIGMTPDYRKVHNHFLCLTTEDKTVLLSPERNEFQKWIDDEGEQIDIEKESLPDSERAARLVTFYCRHKHNDWSEEWIRSHWKKEPLGKYTSWMNDLVKICRSHHYGLEELKSDAFTPIKIHGRVIHKRYIAMCLRVADVTEIDPERAPEVLIKHRDIIEGSISHWLKEKFTSVEVINNSISITAQPERAFIHKAILDIAEQIETETKLCNNLIAEKPLRDMAPTNDLTHEWNIHPTIFRGNIKEAGNYEFVDGTFKPNSKKLLELLAGTHLYGNPLLAIRELIQNSLDAIKIQLAYKVLKENSNDITDENICQLQSKFHLKLRIEKKDDEYWLVCEDNGVGMDKEIILKCFLVGGATKRHDLLELERKCAELNYNLETTGQFGVGVMSYFMIADKMTITTKKSYESGYYESKGYQFEIDGLSDFGELKRVEFNNHGTTIKLRIRKEFIKDVTSDSLFKFLETTLIRIPCNFTFESIDGDAGLVYAPGWCKSPNFFKRNLIVDFDYAMAPMSITKFTLEEEKTFIELFNQRQNEIKRRFISSVDFISTHGKLEDDIGYYRIHIPVFKNQKGESLSFFFEVNKENDIFFEKTERLYFFTPEAKYVENSWKGIHVNGHNSFIGALHKYRFYVEIDLVNGRKYNISVSRNQIETETEEISIDHEIQAIVDKLFVSSLHRFTNSIYAFANHLQNPSAIELIPNNQYWLDMSHKYEKLIKFTPIKHPLLYAYNSKLQDVPYIRLISRGHEFDLDGIRFERSLFKIDRAVFTSPTDLNVAFLMTAPLMPNKFSAAGNSSRFPIHWNEILFVRTEDYDVVFNENHPSVNYAIDYDIMYLNGLFNHQQGLTEDRFEEIVSDSSTAFNFMLYIMFYRLKSHWIVLCKEHNQFINRLWSKAFEKGDVDSFCFLDNSEPDNIKLTNISINGWSEIIGKENILKIIPVPIEQEWGMNL